MRETSVNLEQFIVNKCNSRVDFTIDIDENGNAIPECKVLEGYTSLYAVGIKNIMCTKNPSLKLDLRDHVADAIQAATVLAVDSKASVGGWLSPDGYYCLDVVINIEYRDDALYAAEIGNESYIYDRVKDKLIKV